MHSILYLIGISTEEKDFLTIWQRNCKEGKIALLQLCFVIPFFHEIVGAGCLHPGNLNCGVSQSGSKNFITKGQLISNVLLVSLFRPKYQRKNLTISALESNKVLKATK